MMLRKLTLLATSFNLSNQKRKRPTSLVANIGPILQRIKRTLSSSGNNDTAQRSNTIHCYLSEYQENESAAMQEQDHCWSQETRLYALCNEKLFTRPQYQVQPRENWWST